MSGPGFIAAEPNGQCDLCGAIDETRPYGPKGEQVCHPCGMKNPEVTQMRFEHHVLGQPLDEAALARAIRWNASRPTEGGSE